MKKKQLLNNGSYTSNFIKIRLHCDHCNRGHLDKVDQSDYEKITIQSYKVSCQSTKRNNQL